MPLYSLLFWQVFNHGCCSIVKLGESRVFPCESLYWFIFSSLQLDESLFVACWFSCKHVELLKNYINSPKSGNHFLRAKFFADNWKTFLMIISRGILSRRPVLESVEGDVGPKWWVSRQKPFVIEHYKKRKHFRDFFFPVYFLRF